MILCCAHPLLRHFSTRARRGRQQPLLKVHSESLTRSHALQLKKKNVWPFLNTFKHKISISCPGPFTPPLPPSSLLMHLMRASVTHFLHESKRQGRDEMVYIHRVEHHPPFSDCLLRTASLSEGTLTCSLGIASIFH